MASLTLSEAHNNLDLFCVSYAQALTVAVKTAFGADKAAEKAENLITRALGVLQEHGIYAAFLWLEVQATKGKEPEKSADCRAAKQIRDSLAMLIKATAGFDLGEGTVILTHLQEKDGLLSQLSALLLVKRVIEQTLVYARYHAKAGGADGR